MKRLILLIALVIVAVFALLALEDRFVGWSNGVRYNIPRNMEWSPQVEQSIAARQLREAAASTRSTTAPTTSSVHRLEKGSASRDGH